MGLWMHNLVQKFFGLCYDSGMVSLSSYLCLFMGIFGLVLVMFSHDQDQYLFGLLDGVCLLGLLGQVCWVGLLGQVFLVRFAR